MNILNISYSCINCSGQAQAEGFPILIYFAHDKSIPEFIPKALQLGVLGLQIQQPIGLKPGLHFG